MGKIRKKILPFRDLQRFIDKGLCPHEFENTTVLAQKVMKQNSCIT